MAERKPAPQEIRRFWRSMLAGRAPSTRPAEPPRPAKPRRRWGAVRNTLRRIASEDGIISGYTHDRIARLAGVTRSGAKQSIEYMLRAGQMERITSRGGQGVANTYRLLPGSTRNRPVFHAEHGPAGPRRDTPPEPPALGAYSARGRGMDVVTTT